MNFFSYYNQSNGDHSNWIISAVIATQPNSFTDKPHETINKYNHLWLQNGEKKNIPTNRKIVENYFFEMIIQALKSNRLLKNSEGVTFTTHTRKKSRIKWTKVLLSKNTSKNDCCFFNAFCVCVCVRFASEKRGFD